MSLRKDGEEFPGNGIVDGDTATFIPQSQTLRPRVGDLIEYEGITRTVFSVLGTNDAWALTLGDEAVPDLADNSAFEFNVEAIGAGRILFTRLGAGAAKVQGRWRVNNGAWVGFSMPGRSLVVDTGPGTVEVTAYRVDREGKSTEPVNRSIEATGGGAPSTVTRPLGVALSVPTVLFANEQVPIEADATGGDGSLIQYGYQFTRDDGNFPGTIARDADSNEQGSNIRRVLDQGSILYRPANISPNLSNMMWRAGAPYVVDFNADVQQGEERARSQEVTRTVYDRGRLAVGQGSTGSLTFTNTPFIAYVSSSVVGRLQVYTGIPLVASPTNMSIALRLNENAARGEQERFGSGDGSIRGTNLSPTNAVMEILGQSPGNFNNTRTTNKYWFATVSVNVAGARDDYPNEFELGDVVIAQAASNRGAAAIIVPFTANNVVKSGTQHNLRAFQVETFAVFNRARSLRFDGWASDSGSITNSTQLNNAVWTAPTVTQQTDTIVRMNTSWWTSRQVYSPISNGVEMPVRVIP